MNSKQARELLTVDGFIRHFYSIIRDNPDITHYQAYEQAEQEYEKHFGCHKYSCFDTFRKMKSRRLKKKQ
jgi:hypothetical protein